MRDFRACPRPTTQGNPNALQLQQQMLQQTQQMKQQMAQSQTQPQSNQSMNQQNQQMQMQQMQMQSQQNTPGLLDARLVSIDVWPSQWSLGRREQLH